MLVTDTKVMPVGAEWPIGFEFHGEDLAGLTIIAAEASVLPAGLTVSAPVINAAADGFYSWMSGGVVDVDYYVTFLWTRSDGKVTPDIMRVSVR